MADMQATRNKPETLNKMTIGELKTVLADAIKNKEQLLIVGEPGIGKTEVIRQVCDEIGADLIIAHPSVSDPTDYKGLPSKANDGSHAVFLPFGETWQAIKAEKLTVYFIDDLGQASDAVQKALMQLLLGRRLNGHKLSDNVVFIGATNDIGQRAGVSGLLEPIKSRFDSIVFMDTTIEDWSSWALNNNMPPELIAFLRNRPELLSKFEPTKALVNSPSPRTWASVGRRLMRGVSNFKLFSGSVGKGSATELMAFLELAKEAPNLDDIIMNPEKAPIPSKPALKYVVSTGLAYRAKKDNFKRIFTYLNRLEQPFRVYTIKDAITRNKELTQTEVFIKWACSEGKEIL